MNFNEYPDRDMAIMGLADVLAGELRKCLSLHNHASFAVPGGTTPGPIFDVLSAVELDWARVHVMLTDERWVPEDHPRSNAALVRERLIRDKAAAATFVPFYADGTDRQAAVARQAASLDPELPLSLLLLGMGADMHVASLFPGAAEAGLAADAPSLVAVDVPGQEPRVSLSAAVLDGAMSKHLVIFGAEKREALERSAGMAPKDAPVQAVLKDMNIHWAE